MESESDQRQLSLSGVFVSIASFLFLALVAYLGGIIGWLYSIQEPGSDINVYGAFVKAHESSRFAGFAAMVLIIAAIRLVGLLVRRNRNSRPTM